MNINPITVNVWLSNPQDALELNTEDSARLFDQVVLARESVNMSEYGWALIGKAAISFDITSSPQDIQLESIRALETGLRKLDGEHEAKRNIILDTINKLKAIPYHGRSEE